MTPTAHAANADDAAHAANTANAADAINAAEIAAGAVGKDPTRDLNLSKMVPQIWAGRKAVPDVKD